jgi:predicted DNA-binding transcriptional regulator AlpA
MVISIMNGLSSREAAKKLGLSFTSLNRYIAAKKIPLPPLVRVGGVRVRLWSDKDIADVRALLPKLKNGRKLRYKKKSSKKTSKKK